MRSKHIIALLFGWLLAAAPPVGAQEAGRQIKTVVISADSVRIDGTDLRGPGSKKGTPRYFSLPAATRALGQPTEKYRAGLGVLVYSWHNFGIHLQQGWRGPEKGKWFSFQVYLHDYFDGRENRHTSKYPGRLSLDGIELSAGAKFSDIQSALEKQGYTIKTAWGISIAEKGRTLMFTFKASGGSHAKTTDQIGYVEVWSGQ